VIIPLQYNLRYLRTRWTGTLITAVTFGLVVAVFVIVMALAQGLDRAFVTTGDPLNLLIMRPGVQSEMQSNVSIDRYQIIRTLEGIATGADGEPIVAPEVLVVVNKPKLPDGGKSNLQVRGIDLKTLELRPQVRIVEGRMYKPGLREVIASRLVSKRFQGFRLGDTPTLGGGTWTVVGLFDAAGTAYDSEVWCDYEELQQEFDRRGGYSTVVARATDPAAAASLARTIDEDPRLKLEVKTEVQYYSEQTSTSTPLKLFGTFLATVMAIGACFAGMNTMYGNVASRSKEIGTLRVLGYTPVSIVLCFVSESVLLALIGGIFGCLLSLPMNWVTTGTTNFQTFSEVVFQFAVTPRLMGIALGFAVVMGVVGGLLPAVSAARRPIIDCLSKV
jgi:putative ABC transport system permease protein